MSWRELGAQVRYIKPVCQNITVWQAHYGQCHATSLGSLTVWSATFIQDFRQET